MHLVTLLYIIHFVPGTECTRLNQTACDDSDPQPCNCRYVKPYNQSLSIPCFNSFNCNWYHRIDCTLQPFQNMTNTNGIGLPANFDPESYGIFTSNTSNDSCYYAVIPPSNLGMYIDSLICYFAC